MTMTGSNLADHRLLEVLVAPCSAPRSSHGGVALRHPSNDPHRRPRPPRLPPPPRLRRPGADVLRARLGGRRRLPVRHQLLGGLPLLDTRSGVHLVHPVHDLPALMRRAAQRRTRRRRPPPSPGWGGRRSPPGKLPAAPQWLRRPGVAFPPRIMRGGVRGTTSPQGKELEHREAAANSWRFNPHETPILSISGGRCRTPQNGRCPICPINVR